MRSACHWISKFHLFLLGLLAVCGISAQAQDVAVRIASTHAKGQFWVDGAQYEGSAVFSWAPGSKHVLEVRDSEQALGTGDSTRLRFVGWSEESGKILNLSSPVLAITADPQVTSYLAQFTTEHLVEVIFNNQPIDRRVGPCYTQLPGSSTPPPGPSQSGFVQISGASCQCLYASTYFYAPENTALILNAVPFPEYAFVSYGINIPAGTPGAARLSVTRPLRFSVNFDLARRHTFETSPVRGFKVIVNGAGMDTRHQEGKCLPSPGGTAYPDTSGIPLPGAGPYPACTVVPLCTGDLDLLPGSTHRLSAPVVQKDSTGKPWVFDSWDYGAQDYPGQNFVYTVPNDFRPSTFQARFVPGANMYFHTKPEGLKLTIDGRNNWWFNGFTWGVGHKHAISAPAEQTDAQGRRYVFKGWSNGGPADQEIVVTEEHASSYLSLTAEYEPLGQVTLRSEPDGVLFQVGETECHTPCTLDRAAGTRVTVRAASQQEYGEDIRAQFSGWTDGVEESERELVFGSEARVLVARYRMMNRLRMMSNPEEGVDFALEPQPVDAEWFEAGQQVSVTAKARKGFKFRRWDGFLSGTYPTGTLTMSGPATILALLDKVPALKEGAVRNAAAKVPGEGVAPGSLIAIDGYNMAETFEEGPTNPLKQILQGVFVQAAGRILPLVSVSQETIVAVLPSDLRTGKHKLTVTTPGQPDLTSEFTVIRNAPAIFHETNEDIDYAISFHEDGSRITATSPARRGELVRLMGTGFGPLKPLPPDGFPVPESPEYRLEDPVEIMLDGRLFPVESVSAAVGLHGVVWVTIRVTDDWPSGQTAGLSVRVNGQDGNQVGLPLE